MTKAEEAALEAYPINMTPLVYQDMIDMFGGKTEIDTNTYPRCLFQQGYELAEKDINKELMDIMADIREKQEKAMYADYDIHIDTSNASDTSVACVFKGNKVVDLLTWEDIERIEHYCEQVNREHNMGTFRGTPYGKSFYKEVLRRFKAIKEEKK